MLSWIESLILGVLQGLTEFFPVSSSAHLKIAKLILGIEAGEGVVLFDLSCHLGTLAALLFFLRREIFFLLTKERRKLLLFFAALVPLVPVYFLLKPVRDIASQNNYLGYALIVTALILFMGQRLRIKETKKHLPDALCIGAMQSVALIPGISRSASTISCARTLGWSAEEAVQFSFLLAIPTIVGGSFLETAKLFFSPHTFAFSISFSSCLIGFLSSLGVGMAMIGPAMRWLKKGRLQPCAWYCLLLGTTLLLLWL